MKDALVDNYLAEGRIDLAKRRIKRLCSDIFDEIHGTKAYLVAHPGSPELIDDFKDSIAAIAEEFMITEIINGDILDQD